MHKKIKLIKSILNEYGIKWAICRIIYTLKIKMMNKCKKTWKLFEKKVKIKNIDIFDIKINKLECFLKSLDEIDQDKIIKEANDAINGKIKAFSSIILDYGNPIKWNYNPITEESVSFQKYWFEIKDFDKNIGDIKVIWEPSRFCYLFLFSRAYLITKDIKYYEAFSKHIELWVKNNRYPYGPNFKCGQEATIRMINLLLNYTVFKYYNLITEKDKKNIIYIIETSYKKVQSNFFYAHRCIKNNHTLSEIMGLIIGAICCQETKKMKKAYNLLFKEIKSQIFEDGGYVQYSFNYHRFVLQLLEILFKLEDKTRNNNT